LASWNDEGLLQSLHDEALIRRVLIAYATTVDSRNWPALDDVFEASASAVYGSDPAFQFRCRDREQIRAMCRANLDGCGPTQHLLTNFRIDVDSDRATSVCSVQAGHFGIGDAAGTRYELWGEYRDELARGDSGWRIVKRQLHVIHEFGERDRVLGPGKS
jgi:hypothetical protein